MNYKKGNRIECIEIFHFKKLWNKMLSLTTRSSWSATYISSVYLPLTTVTEDVALENFTKHFLHQFYDKEHAMKLIKLQIQQGGQVFFQDVRKPDHECSGVCITPGKNWISHYWKLINWPVNDSLLVWLSWDLVPKLATEIHQRIEWPQNQLTQDGGFSLWHERVSLTSTPWERMIMRAKF